MSHVRLHWQYIKMKYAARMSYPTDFFFSLVAFFFFQMIGPLVIGAIYYSGGVFEGWTLHQALLLQGVLLTISGFSHVFFFGILWKSIDMVKKGTLELLLLRPINTLRLLIMEGFDDEDIAQFTGGLAVLIYALSNLQVTWAAVGVMVLSMVMGVIFLFSLAMLCSAATIKWVETWRLYEFLDIFFRFASYPKNIYSRSVGFLFTAILPLFVLAYYPAALFLGFSLEGMWLANAVVIILAIVAYWVWKHTLKSYTGAGG